MEEWRDIKGYENNYQVSNLGRVKNKKRNKILNKWNTKGKYEFVTLSLSGVLKCITVHRLVAIAFIPNPENKRCVNHIDGNKLNNNLTNLEWVTHKENTLHAIKIGLYDTELVRLKQKPVLMLTLDSEPLLWFNSIIEVERISGINRSNIASCCRGNLNTAGGYKWEFKNKEEETR